MSATDIDHRVRLAAFDFLTQQTQLHETDQEVVVAELGGPEGSWFFRIKGYDEGGKEVWEAGSRSRAVLQARFVIQARCSVR